MKIRKATCKDINQLNKLLANLFAKEVELLPDSKKQKKGLKGIITDKKVGQIFVACKKEKIIGMINLLYSISTSHGSRVGIIEDVIVAPIERGKGVGSKLMQYTKKYADKKKLKRLTLFTDFDNYKAHKFYEQQGFAHSSMVQFKRQ